MCKLLLKVFLSPFPAEFEGQQPEEIHQYYCQINNNFLEIQDALLSLLGEGFRSESNQKGEYCFLTVYLLWNRPLDRFKSYFSQFKPIEKFDPVEEFSRDEQEYVILIDTESLSNDDLAALQDLLKKDNIDEQLLMAKQISEWGASGYFDQLIIKIAVDLTKEVIFKLAKKIRELFAGKENQIVNVINIRQEVKKELMREYGLRSKEVYLSTFRELQDGAHLLVYKSENHTYRIETDKRGNITGMRMDELSKIPSQQ